MFLVGASAWGGECVGVFRVVVVDVRVGAQRRMPRIPLSFRSSRRMMTALVAHLGKHRVPGSQRAHGTR